MFPARGRPDVEAAPSELLDLDAGLLSYLLGFGAVSTVNVAQPRGGGLERGGQRPL